MPTRKNTLAECNPHWVRYHDKEDGPIDALYFECPEGHEGCITILPFTPALDGAAQPVKQRNGAQWTRESGDTFENLTLSPSIRTIQSYANREEAIKAGCIPEYITERMFCAMHIFIKNGKIEFCGDSK